MPGIVSPLPGPEPFSIGPMLTAFSAGQQAKTALEDRQRAMEQQAQDAIYRAAFLADTPEKWDRLITTLEPAFGADLSEWRDFSTRDAAISLDPNYYQRENLNIAQERLRMDQAAANTPQAPTPRTDAGDILYDWRNGLYGDPTSPEAVQLRDSLLQPFMGGDPVDGYHDEIRTIGGIDVYGQVDAATGEFKPYRSDLQPSAPQQGFEWLTGEQIAALNEQGVALDPTRAYQRNLETGEVTPVGGQASGMRLITNPDGTFTFEQGTGVSGGSSSAQERQAAALYPTTLADFQIVQGNFNELSNLLNQAANAVPILGNFVVSEGYQRALNATMNILQNFLVVTSGQAVTEQEAERRARQVLPAAGDNPATIQDKLRRIQDWVDAIQRAGGRALETDAAVPAAPTAATPAQGAANNTGLGPPGTPPSGAEILYNQTDPNAPGIWYDETLHQWRPVQ